MSFKCNFSTEGYGEMQEPKLKAMNRLKPWHPACSVFVDEYSRWNGQVHFCTYCLNKIYFRICEIRLSIILWDWVVCVYKHGWLKFMDIYRQRPINIINMCYQNLRFLAFVLVICCSTMLNNQCTCHNVMMFVLYIFSCK